MSHLPPWRKPAHITVRALCLLTLPFLLVLGLASVSPAEAKAADAGAARRELSDLTITVLPPIRQPGARAASISRALATVLVTVRPATAGRTVSLERSTGRRWREVGTERTDASGQATFFVPARDADGSEFRASTTSLRGRPQVTTRIGAPDWGTPDFVDEFDGDTLGAAWSHRIQFYNPWGGRACSKGDPSAVEVRDGTLRLTSAVDPAATDLCPATDAAGQPIGSYPHRLNANISTQYSADFLYGVAAARMRFPRSMGQHASFWLQPRGLLDTGTTPWGSEVDVVEYYGARGNRSVMGSAVHEPLPSGEKRQIGGMIPGVDRFLTSRSDRWWTRFHVFSVEWTPEEYVFRIGGREVWRTDQGVSDVPEFLILSMLSSDYELPEIGADTSPRTAEVDWVAFWRAD